MNDKLSKLSPFAVGHNYKVVNGYTEIQLDALRLKGQPTSYVDYLVLKVSHLIILKNDLIVLEKLLTYLEGA